MDDKAGARKDSHSSDVSRQVTEPQHADTTTSSSQDIGSDLHSDLETSAQKSRIDSATCTDPPVGLREVPSSSQAFDPPPRVIASTSIKTQSSSRGPSSQTQSPIDSIPNYPFQQHQPNLPSQLGEEIPQANPEVHHDEPDPFSDYSDDAASLTESINSLNYQYQCINGRRYHGFNDAAYLLPNDEREQERLEGQHQTWLMILGGKLHLAPLKSNIQNVLDVATGTGNWAMDFADQYPSARVFGTDLSPIQPNFVPPNCTFIVEDSEKEWVWEERFDLIHSRTLSSAWRDWPGYFQKAFQFLKPGGYIELHEFTFPFHCDDDTAGPDHPMIRWSQLMADGAAKGGVDMEQCASLEGWLKDAGFVDVVKITKRQPFTGWSEDPDEARRGEFYGMIFDWGLSMALMTSRLGWSREQTELFLVEVRKAASDRGAHVYIPLYCYTARKPESAT